MKENLNKIDFGMDKTDVIDRIGSPQRSFRHNNQDVWLYRVYENDAQYFHEICFEQERVVYTGPERDLKSKQAPAGLRTQEEAQEVLRNKLQPTKKPKDFKEIKEDGSY